MNDRLDVISIENTTLCGANCIMCPRERFLFHGQTMSQALFEKCVDQAVDLGISLLNFCGFGDACCDKDFGKKLKYVKMKYPDILVGLTNTCHRIEGEMLDLVCDYVDQLQISMYGIKKETYESIHRGSLHFEQIKKNIDNLINRSNRPKIFMEFLYMPENADDLNMWRDYYEPRVDRCDVWKIQNWAGYIEDPDRERPFTSCIKIRSLNGLYIRADGSVSMCCIDYNRQFILGNMNEKQLRDIIQSDDVVEIQKMNEDGRIAKYGICKNCDQIHDRSDALLYSSDKNMQAGRHPQLVNKDVY